MIGLFNWSVTGGHSPTNGFAVRLRKIVLNKPIRFQEIGAVFND